MEKNLRQLGGARRQLFELKTEVQLKNPRRGTEVLDISGVKEVYLISVILSATESQAVQPIPFVQLVKGHPAHVFVRQFTELVLNELDTVADFCDFVRALEKSQGKDADNSQLGARGADGALPPEREDF